MAIYKYGEGCVCATVQISASIALTINPLPPIEEPHIALFPRARAENIGVDLFGVTATLTPTYSPVSETETLQIGYLVAVSGFGKSDQNINYVGSLNTHTQGEEATGTLNTSFTVTRPTEKFIEITSDDNVSILDAPFGTVKVRLFERYSEGGHAEAGGASILGSGDAGQEVGYISGAGISATASDGGSGAWSVTYPSGFDVVSATAPGQTTSGSVTDTAGSGSASAPTSFALSSNPHKSVSGGIGAQVAPSRSFALSGVVRAMEAAYPSALVGSCYKFAGDPNPDFDVSGGAFSVTHSQKWGMVNAVYYGEGGKGYPLADATQHEWRPVQCSIKPGSLIDANDDVGGDDPMSPLYQPRATRLLMRGRRFSALTLAHDTHTLIDGCTSLSATGAWSGSWEAIEPDTAPTLVSNGGIRFLRRVRRSFSHDVSLSGYRYLRFRVKANVANGAFTLSIGSKVWQAKTGTTADEAADVDIDLCAETSETASSSLHDTKWPVDQHNGYDSNGTFIGIVGDYLPMNEGIFFGVGRCSAITINGASGTMFVVERVELVRHAAPTVTLMPAFYRGQIASTPSGDGQYVDDPWPAEQYPPRPTGTDEGGISDYAARRFLLANVDGRQGLEEEDSSYVYVSPAEDGPSQVIRQQQTIKDVVDSINRVNSDGTILNPGWTATSLKPPTGCTAPAGAPASWLPSFQNCYLSDSLPATCLFGGGALAGPSGWEFGFDRPLGSYEAQMLFDEINWYPGCGDFFEFGAGGGTSGASGPLLLKAAAILRGAAQGLTLQANKQVAPNQAVELHQGTPSPGTVVSSGISGASGWYRTGSGPFAKTVQAGTLTSGGASVGVSAFYGRKRQRAVIVVAGNPCEGLLMQNAHFFPFSPQFSDASALPFENIPGLTGTSTDPEKVSTTTDEGSSTEPEG